MKDRGIPLLEKFLNSGEIIVAEKPVLISTVLGSCVSVTMFHQHTGTAAICHALMPRGAGSGSFRYVDESLRHMVKYLTRRKIELHEVEIKLFGGADMFNYSELNTASVGRQNISAAFSELKGYGLPPAACDTGGCRGRKIFFRTDTGAVYLKRLGSRKGEIKSGCTKK